MNYYLSLTKFNTYKYVRRVPKQLLDYIDIPTFRVSLGEDKQEAAIQAISFNSTIEKAISLSSLGVSIQIINEELKPLIPQNKIKESSDDSLFSSIVNEYIHSNKTSVSPKETIAKQYFYHTLCPALFKKVMGTSNPKLENLTFKHLLKVKDILIKLPKRNIQEYRDMSTSEIIKILDYVPKDNVVSSATVSKYIKKLRALYSFAIFRGLIQVNLAQGIPIPSTLENKYQRLPLSSAELQTILVRISKDKVYLLNILQLTGMRLSELYKCELQIIDDILCFSLLNPTRKLKTQASYRVIPVHSSLLPNIDNFSNIRDNTSDTSLARTTSTIIKKLDFKDKDKKSLYSLRHKFATELIQRGANPSVVSELMGHSHKTMTLSRYSTGFSVEQLKEVIEIL